MSFGKSHGFASPAFGSAGSPKSAFGNQVSISYISGIPVPDQINTPELVVLFRSLLKNSAVTREKGLQELYKYVERHPESIDSELQWQWVLIYPKLAIDISVSVRLLAQKTQGLIYSILGKSSQKHLKSAIGPWLCGLYDPGAGVAKATQESLELVFSSSEKRSALWKIYREALISFIYDATCVESKSSLYDERYVTGEEAEASYFRVLFSCVKVLTNILARKEESKNADISTITDEANFWKLCYSGNIQLQRAVFQFTRGLVIEYKDVAYQSLDNISSALMKCCSQSTKLPGQVLPDILRTTAALCNAFPGEALKSKKAKTAVELIIVKGSRESGVNFWKEIPDFVNALPDNLKPTLETLLSALEREPLANCISEGANVVLQLHPEALLPVVDIICFSNQSFRADVYFSIGKKLATAETNFLDATVKRCIELDTAERQGSAVVRQGHLEKAILILQAANIKSEELSKTVEETLKTLDSTKLPLVVSVLASTKLYVLSNETFSAFATKITEGKYPLDEKLLKIFLYGKSNEGFQEYLEKLIRRIVELDEEEAERSTALLLKHYKELGVTEPSDALCGFFSNLHIQEIPAFGPLFDCLVYGVCAEGTLISSNTSHDLLNILAGIGLDSYTENTLSALEKIAKINSPALSVYTSSTDGSFFAAKLHTCGERGQILIQKIAQESNLVSDIVLKSLTNLRLEDVGEVIDMANNLWKIDSDVKASLEDMTPGPYGAVVPIDYAMVYHEALLLEEKLTPSGKEVISHDLIAKAYFVASVAEKRNLSLDENKIISLAVIAEMCDAFVENSPVETEQVREFQHVTKKLLERNSKAIADTLFGVRELTPYGFYCSLVLEKVLREKNIQELLAAIKGKKDFVSLAVLRYLENSRDIFQVRDQLVSQLVGATSIPLADLTLANNAVNSTGASIPINRLNMVLKSLSAAMSSDDSFSAEFVATRVEIVIFLKSIIRDYSSLLLSTHWVQIVHAIEENLALVSDSSQIYAVLNYYTLHLLQELINVSSNIEIEAFDKEKQTEIFSQAVDTFSEKISSVCTYSRFLLQVAEPISKNKTVVLDLDVDALYGVLRDASDNFMVGASALLLAASIQSKQEDVSIEYQLSRGEMDVKLPFQLMEIVRSVPPKGERAFLYLTAWLLLLSHFDSSSYELRRAYIKELQVPIHNMLDYIFGGQLEGIENVAMDEDIQHYKFAGNLEVNPIARHIYFKTVTFINSVVRGWFLGLRAVGVSKNVELFTKTNISRKLFNEELTSINSQQEEDFRLEKKDKSVRVYYQVDDEEGIIDVMFPDAYPLEDISIKAERLVGIPQKRWRGVSASMQAASMSHNGRLLEILSILKKSIKTYFDGVEECAICYAVVHSDLTLPEKTCSTCKKKFHTECLYRWFKSSNSSACPLCRSPFKVQLRQAPNPMLV